MLKHLSLRKKNFLRLELQFFARKHSKILRLISENFLQKIRKYLISKSQNLMGKKQKKFWEKKKFYNLRNFNFWKFSELQKFKILNFSKFFFFVDFFQNFLKISDLFLANFLLFKLKYFHVFFRKFLRIISKSF